MPEYTLTPFEFFIYLAVMAGVTYLLRLLPMLFIRKPIKNRYVRSVLYYMPYAVLTVMSVPAIFHVTDNVFTGIAAAICAVALAYFKRNLVTVAAGATATVFICELIAKLIQQ